MKMTNISWQHRLYHRIHTYVVFDNDRNVVVNNISRMRVPLLIPTPTTMRCRSVDTILPRMMRLLIALSLKSSDQSCHLMFSFCPSKTLCRNCTRMIDRLIDRCGMQDVVCEWCDVGWKDVLIVLLHCRGMTSSDKLSDRYNGLPVRHSPMILILSISKKH